MPKFSAGAGGKPSKATYSPRPILAISPPRLEIGGQLVLVDAKSRHRLKEAATGFEQRIAL